MLDCNQDAYTCSKRKLSTGRGGPLVRITKDQSMQLDSIRAISALIVLAGHTNQTILAPTLSHGSTIVGYFTQLSVMVFFVLSGFLIGKSIYNNKNRNTDFKFSEYARDRALRLYPPLIATLLLMLFFAAIAPLFFPSGTNSLLSLPGASFVRTEYVFDINQALGALLFLNEFKTATPSSNGPLWSLSIEFWYYVVAAAIFSWNNRKSLAIMLVLAAYLITRNNQLFIMLCPVWFSGLGLAILHQRRPLMCNKLFSYLITALSFATLIAIVLVWNSDDSPKRIWQDPINYFRLSSGLWFACYLALLMGGAVKFPTWFHKHSGYSYSLYVTHFPVMLFILGVTQGYIYGSILNSFIVAIATITTSIFIAKLVAGYAENKTSIQKTLYGFKRLIYSR